MPFILHCAGGYRSMIAASMLKQKGFDNFVDVIGGFAAIKDTNLVKTDYVCPSTLL
jgi:rhodanese-related sulfurtransferase